MRISAISILILAAMLGFLVNFVLFSPGFLDNDTLGQMIQAQKNLYDNWHPPLMAYTWHWMLKVVPGSWGFFLLEISTFWIGFAILIYGMLPRRPLLAATLTLVLGLNPGIFAINSLVWKDAVFGSMLTLACALLWLWDQQTRTRIWLLALAFVLLFYSMGLRHNGIFAIVPLIAWSLNRGLKTTPAVWRAVLCIVVLGTFTFAHQRLSRWIIAGDDRFPEQVFMTFDLAGISARANVGLPAPRADLNLDEIKNLYQSYSVLPLIWEDSRTAGARRVGFLYANDREPWFSAWKAAIVKHPLEYLQHRTRFVIDFLGIGVGAERGYMFFPADNVPQNGSFLRSDRMTRDFVAWLRAHEHDIEFRAYFYFFPLLLLTAYFVRRRDSFAIALGASGILYMFSFFMVGVAADYRYSFWASILASALGARFLGIILDKMCVESRSIGASNERKPKEEFQTAEQVGDSVAPGIHI